MTTSSTAGQAESNDSGGEPSVRGLQRTSNRESGRQSHDDDRLYGAIKGCQSKKRYRSANAAGLAASSALSKGSTDTLRVYVCPVCDGFHLTKSGLSEFASASYDEVAA